MTANGSAPVAAANRTKYQKGKQGRDQHPERDIAQLIKGERCIAHRLAKKLPANIAQPPHLKLVQGVDGKGFGGVTLAAIPFSVTFGTVVRATA